MVGWGGVHSHFHVQPYCSVEVVLCCRWGCDNNNKEKNPHLNLLEMNSTGGIWNKEKGLGRMHTGQRSRDKGFEIRPKLSLTLKTKSCLL